MSKSIKVSDEVYNQLLAFQDKRETFSQAIERLLALIEKMGELRDILEGGKRFEEWKQEQLAQKLDDQRERYR